MKSNQMLYTPNKKIVIASSFEGVVNNGATECAFVAINTVRRMVARGYMPFHGRDRARVKQYSIDTFKSFKDLPQTQAFLRLRPLVAVAGDYLTVLQIVADNEDDAKQLVDGVHVESNINFFSREFEVQKKKSSKEREIFGKEFYVVRKETQDKDYKAWLSLQEPFPHTIEQLRILNSLKNAQDNDFSGFVLYYVTSKDEASTYQLCNVYGELNIFKNGEISEVKFKPGVDYAKWFENLKTCMISEERIIGKNNVVDADKIKQMIMVSDKENVPREQVFRVQDRYDENEIETLKQEGFRHHLIVNGGYAFPLDYAKAQKAGIPVIERADMAKSLSEYAKNNGF